MQYGKKTFMLGNKFLQLTKNVIVVAELHLGPRTWIQDYELIKRNIHNTLQQVQDLLKREGPRELLILGDVKEKIGVPPPFIKNAIKKGFTKLLENVDQITIIKGNHDGKLEEVLDLDGVSFAKKAVREIQNKQVILFHGHKFFSIEGYDTAVTAHIHPAVNVSSASLSVPLVKVWASFQLSTAKKDIEWLILPAFSNAITGVALNKFSKEQIRQWMPFKQKERLKVKQLTLWHQDHTPLERKTFT